MKCKNFQHDKADVSTIKFKMKYEEQFSWKHLEMGKM